MTLKIFTAKEAGNCAICHKEMKGMRIVMSTKLNQYVHADCAFPNSRREGNHAEPYTSGPAKGGTAGTSPRTSKGGEGRGVGTSHAQAPSYDIDEGLDRAVNRVKALLGEQPELADVSQNLMTEIMRESFDLFKLQEVARAKELEWERDQAKIRAYGKG